MEKLPNSSSEKNICAGAFHCAFTIDFETHVAFPNEIIAFMLSEATVTEVASREGKGAAPSSCSQSSVTKTLAGKAFCEIRFSDVVENTTIIVL